MDELWGRVPLENWRDTPCIVGRVATENDVREGRAVFYVDGPSETADLLLPHCALLRQEVEGVQQVVLIQAERRYDGEVLVGYRPLNGGNGICLLTELELLDSPNPSFG